MFKKIGEDLPVINYLDDDGIVICPDCQEPLVVIAMDEDEVKTICKCKHPEVEQLDA